MGDQFCNNVNKSTSMQITVWEKLEKTTEFFPSLGINGLMIIMALFNRLFTRTLECTLSFQVGIAGFDHG